MANGCETTIGMLGTTRDVSEIFNYVRLCVRRASDGDDGGAEPGIDFNLILPQPPELEGDRLIEWRTAHWGTRGNFPIILGDDPPYESDYGLGCEARIRFYTPTLPPTGIVEALSKRFRQVGLICEYHEPLNQFSGVFSMIDGQFIGHERVRSDEFLDEDAENFEEAVCDRLVEIETAQAEAITEKLRANANSGQLSKR